ncbi:hypothetical protein V2W45_1473015 [Cenococcum geophilum]
MRLLRLEDNEFSLTEIVGNKNLRYAILLHTCGADDEEVAFKDLVKGIGKGTTGYNKILFCGKCYVYLSNVSVNGLLIAPTLVKFFSKDKKRLALRGSPLSYFSINKRMSWVAKRETKCEEDAVFSQLGLFDVHMPLIYGEGRKKALVRLQKEIKESLNEDQTWTLLDSLRFRHVNGC